MAVAVSRDLTVQVLQDVNAIKLSDTQQALQVAVQKGEPKCLGVSQVLLGLLVMCYSIPLHLIKHTEVVTLGVPWWCGLMFFIAGVVTITLDKHVNMRKVQMVLVLSIVSTVMSMIAVTIYSVDLSQDPDFPCDEPECEEKYYSMRLSTGIKSSLLIFTLANGTISTIISILLFRQRGNFPSYALISSAAPLILADPLPVEENQEAITDRISDE